VKPYYDQDGITIYCGDCREIDDLSCDVLCTDPPYGISYSSAWRTKHQRSAEIVGDSGLAAYEMDALPAWARCALVFCRWDKLIAASVRMGQPNSLVVWDKVIHGMADPTTCFAPRHELVLFYRGADFKFDGKRPADVVQIPRVPPERLVHPCEKPLDLLKWLIGAVGGSTVCDPYMGSGTTLLAAKQLGRKAIGIEIEEKYCEIAAKRLSQQVLFGADP